MKKTSDAELRAIAKYQTEKTKMKGIRFFPGEEDLLDHAEATGNFAGYVKSLIRADMQNKQQ